jgi:hypothetical protein
MKNFLQLQIENEIYGLKFNIGTYNHVGTISGQDPFKFRAESEDYIHVMAYAKVIFSAALKANGYMIPETEVQHLFEQLSAADVTLIINMYNNPVDSKPSLNGEVSQHTQGDHVG